MGEAKRRGTYEQRKAIAQEYEERMRNRPSALSGVMAALLACVGVTLPEEEHVRRAL